MSTEEIYQYLSTIIPEYNFDITAVTTGFTDGINLNPNFETLDVPKVAMLVGKGVDPADGRNLAYV
jgi:hypothetical protein